MSGKKALVIVDYQNDFVSGSLGFPGALALAELLGEKAETALAQGVDLIFTLDTHGPGYLSTQEGRRLPVPHCEKGAEGWQLHESVAPFAKQAAAVLEKEAFGSLELGNFLREKGYDEVELAGLVSSICVISNAVIAKAALPQARIVVDARATAGADAGLHEKALDVMAGLQIDIENRESQQKTGNRK